MKYFISIIKIFFIFLLFIIICIIYIFYLVQYRFCQHCVHNLEKIDDNCFECPNKFIFKGFHIASPEETLNQIIYHNKSIARIGDGEMNIIFGKSLGFQKADKKLAKKLQEVLNSNEKNILIGLNLPYQNKILETYTNQRRNHFIKWFKRNKFRALKILKKKKYYSALISRFYIGLKDKTNVPKFIKNLKKIWGGRDIVIVEGDKSRIGFGNDLFNNSKSIKRIICPAENAFELYDKILKAILKLKKKFLVILALGPTATILSYDLSKHGYQAIDLGHADIEYELYLRNASRRIPIPFKYFLEVKNGKKNISEIKDINYLNQIIEKILY